MIVIVGDDLLRTRERFGNAAKKIRVYGAFYRVARYRVDNQDERVKLVIFDDWREKSSYYSSFFFLILID